MQGFFRTVGKVISGIVIFAVLAYLVVNLGGMFGAHQKRSQLNSQLSEQLATKVPAAAAAQDAANDALGPPRSQWTTQQCDFSTDDSGWMVQSYSQGCTLVAVSVYDVDSLDAARSAVRDVPADVFGQPYEPPPGGKPTCVTLRESPENEPWATKAMWVPPQASGEQFWCGRSFGSPYSSRDVTGVVEKLDPTKGALVVVSRTELASMTIGCQHWSILFCDNPFGGDPEWGTLP